MQTTKLLSFEITPSLFYQKLTQPNILYFSQKQDLHHVERFANVDLKSLIIDSLIVFIKIFKEYYERVYNVIQEDCLTLVDVNLVQDRLTNSDKNILSKYLLEPNFYTPSDLVSSVEEQYNVTIHGKSYDIIDASLSINAKQIEDISPLSNLKSLKFLNLSINRISNIWPLINLNNLEVLNLKSNLIEDISVLASLKSLKKLYLSRNRIKDISALFSLHLEDLSLSGNLIEDISPLSDTNSLVSLTLEGNPVKNFTYLMYLEKLKYVLVDANQFPYTSCLKNVDIEVMK